ncbi:hypothetical protein AABB24_029972 [Solanum stoloniferum]|uniref:Uncharacterized protein n=1 Tax=Solanum stoloniferum TaxID=62892 RepID=A0ABD2S1B5_9SOLN
MNEQYGNSRASSSSPSSLNSSSQGTEDDHAIAKILAEEEEIASSTLQGSLGRYLILMMPHLTTGGSLAGWQHMALLSFKFKEMAIASFEPLQISCIIIQSIISM